ncbi:hypothetical protein BVZ46_01787B, partial [Haemophilus influenzae]
YGIFHFVISITNLKILFK